MIENILTVTIGIPAFNEEANIGRLLETLRQQQETNFTIKKIIIVSDDSSDRTDEIVKSYPDNRIQLLRNKKRSGQIFSQNKIFARAKTDIVVLLEADTYPQSLRYVHELIQPIIHDAKVGLVHGNVRPLPCSSLVGRILASQVKSSYRFMIRRMDLDTWFSSGRGGRAFAKTVYSRLVWPPAVPEDTYALFWCRTHKIKNVFRRSAVCRYKIPEQFVDLVRERQKIRSGEKALLAYFPQKYMTMVYNKPKSYMLKPFIYFVFRYPFAFLGYVVLKIMLYDQLTNRRFTDFWPTTYSTKILYNRKRWENQKLLFPLEFLHTMRRKISANFSVPSSIRKLIATP